MRRAGAVTASGASLVLVALTFDAAPLFVPGVALIALGLLTPAWVLLAARGVSVRRALASDRAVEGQAVEATIEVSRGLIRPPALEVVDPLGGETAWESGSVSFAAASRTAAIGRVVRFPRRGRHKFAPPSAVIRDPLDLARALRCGGGDHEVLVLPRTERVSWQGRDLGAISGQAAARTSAEPFAASEVDGLRPYQVGTPAARIHWAALARGAGLLERRMRADTDSRPLVVLDARCADPASESLDAAIRAAASIALELGRRGGCGLLLPGERRAVEIDGDLHAWPAAHARLALIHGGPHTRVPAIAPGARSGRIFYVAAEAPRRLPAALLQSGQVAPVLVLPHGARPSARAELAFEVAGCQGFVLSMARRAAPVREEAPA